MAFHLLDIGAKKAQMNFGFIIAILLLLVLIISASTNILDMIPFVKHESEAAAMEPQAFMLSKLLLDDPGYPADWTSTTVQRVGLLYYDSAENKSVLGQLSSDKILTAANLSYDTVASQLGFYNDTSFRLKIINASGVILDIKNSLPGSTSNVFVIRRILSLDNKWIVNATVEVWE